MHLVGRKRTRKIARNATLYLSVRVTSERKTRARVGAHQIACDYVTGKEQFTLTLHTFMDLATEHERPAKRVKMDDTGAASTPPPNSHKDEDHDEEEPGFVSDNNAAHGSDLYLDTV